LRLDDIERRIARQVVPPKKVQREKKEIADLVIRLIEGEVCPLSEVVGVEIGGSYAKGTWLPENADIDMFVMFKEDVPEKRFRELGERVGFAALKRFGPYVRYSEHPYVEASVRGTKVNVVPCYKVRKGRWKAAADRSRFHTEFMRAKLGEQGQNQVRILKRFLRSNGLYGAEISRQGFSGYVSEVLVWNLGGFRKVLERFAKIGESEVIGKASRRFDTAVTIVDPVDGNRNLAAAISNENVSRMILASRAYLKRPAAVFFRPRKARDAGRILDHVVAVDFGYSRRSPDVMWGQIRKASSVLSRQLGAAGFGVIRNTALSDENGRSALVFLLESVNISENRVNRGPDVFKDGDSASFVAKNLEKSRLMWADGENRVLSLEKRGFDNAVKFLENLLTTGLNRSGVPKGLRADLRRGFRVSAAGRGLRKPIRDGLSEFVTTDEKIFSSR